MERRASQIDAPFEKIDAQIEKNTAAIRDLIAVGRTVIDAQQNTEREMAQTPGIIPG